MNSKLIPSMMVSDPIRLKKVTSIILVWNNFITSLFRLYREVMCDLEIDDEMLKRVFPEEAGLPLSVADVTSGHIPFQTVRRRLQTAGRLCL